MWTNNEEQKSHLHGLYLLAGRDRKTRRTVCSAKALILLPHRVTRVTNRTQILVSHELCIDLYVIFPHINVTLRSYTILIIS